MLCSCPIHERLNENIQLFYVKIWAHLNHHQLNSEIHQLGSTLKSK